MKKGIILEGPYKDGFVEEAFEEGYLGFDKDKLVREGRKTRALKSTLKLRALEMCLLYDKVYLFDQSSYYVYDKLKTEGLVEFVNPKSPKDSPQSRIEQSRNAAFLKPFVLPVLKRSVFRKDTKDPSRFYDIIATLMALDAFSDVSARIDERKDKALEQLKEKRDVEGVDTRPINLHASFLLLRVYTDYVKALLENSAKLGIPAVTTCLEIPKSTTATFFSESMYNDASSDQLWRAYQIYLDEIKFVLKVDSIHDVLRLRDKKRIVDFREALFNWSLEIRRGDGVAEQKMRNSIRRANEELRRVGQCRKIGKWLTYLSIPTTVASLLGGTPVGVVLLPINIGVRIYSDITDWRHRWLLFAR